MHIATLLVVTDARTLKMGTMKTKYMVEECDCFSNTKLSEFIAGFYTFDILKPALTTIPEKTRVISITPVYNVTILAFKADSPILLTLKLVILQK